MTLLFFLKLDTDDFAEVQEALWEARSKWHNIGARLKLGVFELDCINAEPGFGVEEKFNLMIKTRLKKMEPCTWRDLYEALIHPTVDMPSVAGKHTGKLTTGMLIFTMIIIVLLVLFSTTWDWS